MPRRILLVADESGALEAQVRNISNHAWEISRSRDLDHALASIAREGHEVLLLGAKLPASAIVRAIEWLCEEWIASGLLVVRQRGTKATYFGDRPERVDAVLYEPIAPECLRFQVERAFRRHLLRMDPDGEIEDPDEVDNTHSYVNISGRDPVLPRIRAVAHTETPVLLRAEPGLNLESIARRIHKWSSRRERRFHCVDGTANPREELEVLLFGHSRARPTDQPGGERPLSESGGTLFVDAFERLPRSIQTRLARVATRHAESRRMPAPGVGRFPRLVLAVRTGTHGVEASPAEILLQRLAPLRVDVPPLRDRPFEIPRLVASALNRHAERSHPPVRHLTPVALHALVTYSWPGNDRELDEVIRASVVLSESSEITLESLPPHIRTAVSTTDSGPLGFEGTLAQLKKAITERIERAYLAEAIKRHRGNLTAAAQSSHMSRRSLTEKVKAYGIPRVG
jgi:DNA-binding NtrC family response regulator